MFQGYTNETFEFFMALRFNNNTDFFHANRDWYLTHVREPSLALAAELSPFAEAIDDGFERRPNRVLSRINRDIRFSNDKSPYRDYLWLGYRYPKEERSTHLSLYFDLTTEGGHVGMGYHAGYKPYMNAFRARMRTQSEALEAALQPLAGGFRLYTDSYRRMAIPDGIDENLRPLYAAKSFYFERTLSDFDVLKSPALVREIAEAFRLLVPLYHFFDGLVPEEDADATVHRADVPKF